MSKHTAGPWKVEMGHTLELIVADTPDGPVSVAEVLDDCHPDGEQQRANARLIAASPDLLAALIDLYDATTDGRPEVIRAARAVARRAMSKAENGTYEGT